MNYLLKNCSAYCDGRFINKNIDIINDNISNSIVLDLAGCIVVPGFVDVHVHLREPGFSYKETIYSGTQAAAKGGYTTVFSMPNVNPAPDNLINLKKQLDIINCQAVIDVIPIGCISEGRNGLKVSDMESISSYVAGFSDDGSGVQSDIVMEEAMITAKKLNKHIFAHCEDLSLIDKGGVINRCTYADKNNLTGISSESEWKQLERDINLIRKTGCRYHICHVSTKESVELIRKAKKEGLRVTAETAPHYLVFNDKMLIDDGCFKMNPPIRSESDRLALIEGIIDNTIDVIATDHAPHSEEEKNKGLKSSLMGITGLETAFPVLYTELVLKGIITLEKLILLMSINPRKIFNIINQHDLTVIDLNTEYTINSKDFLSMGKSTPFNTKKVKGKIVMTFKNGKIVYSAV